MRKNGKKIATGADIAVCVALSCATVVLYMLLRTLFPAVRDIYTGLVSLFVYLLLLAVFASLRGKYEGISTPDTFNTAFDTDIGAAAGRLPHPILICDKAGSIVYCNPAFLKVSGKTSVPSGTSVGELCRIEDVRGDSAWVSFGSVQCRVHRTAFTHGGIEYTLLNFDNETERLLLAARYNDERTVVAYAIIDNLEEILQFVQDEYAVTAAAVEERLRLWVDSMHGLFKAYDRNKYLLLFDNAGLEHCLKNRFDILDEIRGIRVGDGMSITVSIGVSRASEKTLAEREVAAQYALDLALQRGGDQVVFRDGDEVRFYGGKTKAGYKHVNIKARVMSQRLSALIGRADNVLIMGHRFGDYDSFAACCGLARLVMNQGVRVNVVVNRDDDNLRPCFARISGLSEYTGLFVDGVAGLDMANAGTLLIVADVNNIGYVECPALMQKASTVAVIDHHIKTDAFNAAVQLEYIEPSASSASELVSEIIEQNTGARILRPEEAELLLSGILLDTKRFTRNTGTRTFAMAQFLRGAGANPGETFEFFKATPEDLEREARFNSHVVIYRKHVAIAACEGEDIDASYRIAAAKAADGLLGVKGVNTSFTIVQIEDTVYISARSDGTVNVQVILEKFDGGGHFDVAGAQVRHATVQSVVEQLRASIDYYIDNEQKGEE